MTFWPPAKSVQSLWEMVHLQPLVQTRSISSWLASEMHLRPSHFCWYQLMWVQQVVHNLEGYHFLWNWVSQIYKKSTSIKLQPPYFSDKNSTTLHHHHRYTLPPKQVKIVLKSVFLNKINSLFMIILWLLHFGHQKFYYPIFFFLDIYDPSIFRTPLILKKKW